jgi:Holliday junction resolvase RusA-like endonuclease
LKKIEITIFVEPCAKGRPRFRVIGGHASAYTPTKTRNAEAKIQCSIREHVMKLGTFDARVPLYLAATFYIEKPKSKPKKITSPITRPDLDNYIKTLLDALNKYVIPDDSQIVKMNIEKRYGSPPCIELLIREEIA